MKKLKFTALFLCLFAVVLMAAGCRNTTQEVVNRDKIAVENGEDYWKSVSELSAEEEETALKIVKEGATETSVNQMRSIAERQSQLYQMAEDASYYGEDMIRWTVENNRRHVAYVSILLDPLYEGETERFVTGGSYEGVYIPESRIIKLGCGAFCAVFVQNARGPQVADVLDVCEDGVGEVEKNYVINFDSSEAFVLIYGMETGYTLFHFVDSDLWGWDASDQSGVSSSKPGKSEGSSINLRDPNIQYSGSAVSDDSVILMYTVVLILGGAIVILFARSNYREKRSGRVGYVLCSLVGVFAILWGAFGAYILIDRWVL